MSLCTITQVRATKKVSCSLGDYIYMLNALILAFKIDIAKNKGEW